MHSSFVRCSFFVLILSWALSGLGCTKSSQPSAPAPPPDPIQRGKAVYQSSCTACHNADPRLPGAVGPEVAKSSRELIEARVMHAEYPAGYSPKRKSQLMQPLPQLKDDLGALAAYLNSL
jgi:mono/diheme cytochrome c family protein